MENETFYKNTWQRNDSVGAFARDMNRNSVWCLKLDMMKSVKRFLTESLFVVVEMFLWQQIQLIFLIICSK